MATSYIWHYQSPVGRIVMASNGEALCGLWFQGQKYFADTINGTCHKQELPIFTLTKQWLDIYFSGNAPDFTPPLVMETTEFRKKVWEIMLTIPFGHIMTYGDIAKTISQQCGKKISAQAVGGAVGHNSISLIIPCHRVIGSDGSLTGYAGGIEKKAWLLDMERRGLKETTNLHQ